MERLSKFEGILLISLLVVSILIGVPASAARSDETHGRFIVTVKDGISPAEVISGHGLASRHVYEHALNGFTAVGVTPEERKSLQNDPRVSSLEKDKLLHAVGQTTPTGIDRVEAGQNDVAKIDETDERVDIDIAILDTGIDTDHPDLNVYNGHNFSNGPSWKYDDGNGHGTHVAGTAAAIDDTEGVVGMAPGARLWAIKVLKNNGSGSLSDIIAGIDYVTKHADQIEVANMSLGGQGKSDSFRSAIKNSVAAGVVYVVAAGNDEKDVYGADGKFETDDDFIPAAYPEVATISAMADSDGQPGGNGSDTSYGSDDSFASFSNYSKNVVSNNPVTSSGAAIDLLMPGVEIYSTYKDGGYATMSGTSMSSPHGAGLAALYIAQNGRDADGDGDNDATDVYDTRQALIDEGVAQDSADGLATLNDPDSSWEYIGWASSATGDLPTASWIAPTNDELVEALENIRIDASDNETSDENLTVRWNIDGGNWRETEYNSTESWFENIWDTTEVSDGNHNLNSEVIDSDSNTFTASITVDVQNYDNAPIVSWINPKEGDTVSDNVIVQIEAKDDLDDDNNLTVKWKVKSGEWKKASFNKDTGYYENTWDTTSVSDNDYVLTALAEDSLGNKENAKITVTVSNEAAGPEIDKFEVSEVNSPNPHAEFNVDWTISDGDGNLNTVEIVMEDSSGNTIDSVTESVSGSTASGTTKLKDKHAEKSGKTYDITLKVTDANGNTVEKTKSITEDGK